VYKVKKCWENHCDYWSQRCQAKRSFKQAINNPFQKYNNHILS